MIDSGTCYCCWCGSSALFVLGSQEWQNVIGDVDEEEDEEADEGDDVAESEDQNNEMEDSE